MAHLLLLRRTAARTASAADGRQCEAARDPGRGRHHPAERRRAAGESAQRIERVASAAVKQILWQAIRQQQELEAFVVPRKERPQEKPRLGEPGTEFWSCGISTRQEPTAESIVSSGAASTESSGSGCWRSAQRNPYEVAPGISGIIMT